MRVPLAAAAASLAAGPVAGFVLVSVSFAYPDQEPFEPVGLLAFFGLALVVGFVISVVPNLLGTIAMFLLSQRSAAARAPGCWIAAGATLAFLLAWPLDLFGAGPHLLAPFIAVGACCAAICRLIAWPD